jgi:signal transduction histidine kinase
MCGVPLSKRPDDDLPGPTSSLSQTVAERLHDGPLQDLVALQLKTAVLQRERPFPGENRAEQLTEIAELAQAALQHLQGVIRELCVAEPLRPGLRARLVTLCDEFRAASGISCNLRLHPSHLSFAPEVSEVLFRTIKELLTNVRKHAQATAVTVSSCVRPDGGVAITVEDNGIGISSVNRRANPFEGGGFGLWSIDHRLTAFGGYLELEGETGVQATVVVPRRLLKGD